MKNHRRGAEAWRKPFKKWGGLALEYVLFPEGRAQRKRRARSNAKPAADP